MKLGAATVELAARRGLPHDPLADFVLEYAAGRLQIRDTRQAAPGPFWIDWQSREAANRRRAGRRLLLARACGLKKGKPPPEVIDATAGLGRDAYALAALGCRVTAIECHPAIAALLADALQRAGGSAAANLKLLLGEAAAILPTLPRADVVCIDPMFPGEGGSALARKEMQYFRALIEPGNDVAIFAAAAASGARRIVVKRHKLSPPLAPGRRVDVVFKAESIRFDVYLK